ncbi:MAG: ankyrin repeat domain-containing protein [Alphaproteobacteria bacterium]
MRAFLILILLTIGNAAALAQSNPLAGPEIVRAAGVGETTAVRNALLRGVNPNTRSVRGVTGLIAAAKGGHVDVAKAFIQFKARLNAKDPQGNTALHWAARMDRTLFAEIILRAGADANAIDKFGTTPLMQAAKNGYVETVGVLLRGGAKTDATDYSGRTAADFARTVRRMDIVRLLEATSKN